MGSSMGGVATMTGIGAGMLAAGGGYTVPTVDMSKQIGNANQTYDTATGNAKQTMNTATAYNQNAQDTLKGVVGQETPAMAAVNNAANTNLQTYGSTFTPLQAQQAKQAQDYTNPTNVQNLQARAVTDQTTATNAALANSRASLASEGVDPASIHGGALDEQARVKAAAQAAGASNQSYLQTQDTGRQLVNTANQLGLQVGQQGTGEAATGAGIGAGIISGTNQTNQAGVGNLTAADTYLNTGVNANASSANIANQQFADQMASYKALTAKAASKGAEVGGLASSSVMAGSDIAQSVAMMDGGVVPGTAPSYAGGGPISPHGALPMPIVPGTTDTKLIAATPGEFMLPKDVAQYMGHEKLHNLIDKTREKMHERHGIPHQMSSAHQTFANNAAGA